MRPRVVVVSPMRRSGAMAFGGKGRGAADLANVVRPPLILSLFAPNFGGHDEPIDRAGRRGVRGVNAQDPAKSRVSANRTTLKQLAAVVASAEQ